MPEGTEASGLLEGNEEDKGAALGALGLLACVCCCPFLISFLIVMIMTLTTLSYANCGELGELPSGASAMPPLPNNQVIRGSQGWFEAKYKSYVFDGDDEEKDYGHWVTLQYWFTRRIAFVPEGWETPLAIAKMPFFSFRPHYDLERCDGVGEKLSVTKDFGLFGWGNWQIYNDGKHVGRYDYQTITEPDSSTEVATVEEKYSGWFSSSSKEWTAHISKPDIVSPYVVSFLTVPIKIVAQSSFEQCILIFLLCCCQLPMVKRKKAGGSSQPNE